MENLEEKEHVRSKSEPSLEDNIMSCWNIVDDIHLLNEAVQDQGIDTDSISNILLGLEYMYELKFQKLMASYSQSIKKPLD